MEYNPHAERYGELISEFSFARSQMSLHQEQNRWHDGFNLVNAYAQWSAENAKTQRLAKENSDAGHALIKQQQLINSLTEAARLSWDPSYWFSSVRKAKGQELAQALLAFDVLTVQSRNLALMHETSEAVASNAERQVQRHRDFDREKSSIAERTFYLALVKLEAELEEITPMKEQADDQLREPLATLEDLEHQKTVLCRMLDEAHIFEERLSNSSSAKWVIHNECLAQLGDSSPGKLIRSKQGQLASVDRNIKKLQQRLSVISKRASLVVKEVVIDGNNLCFEQRTFIGLIALLAAVPSLARDYKVFIVFDANICNLLRLKDRQIEAQFKNVAGVHIVASRKEADETLLSAASGPQTVVVSNDRFLDYQSKSAVRDERVFTHEILMGRIFIHDLQVAERFGV